MSRKRKYTAGEKYYLGIIQKLRKVNKGLVAEIDNKDLIINDLIETNENMSALIIELKDRVKVLSEYNRLSPDELKLAIKANARDYELKMSMDRLLNLFAQNY